MKNFISSTWRALPSIRNYFRNKWFTLILYHQIDETLFKKHLEYFSSQYNITPLGSLRDYYENGVPLPKNSLFITFDDGWRSNYSLLPVIEESRIPVTIFLTTGLIGSKRVPAPINYYQGKSLFNIKEDYPIQMERTMLTKQEIKEMSNVLNFQSHGVNHYPSISLNPEQLRSELLESKRTIEALTGKQVYAYAYPYNRAGEREAQIVASCGYKLARIGGRMMNGLKSNPFLLNSIGVTNRFSINKLEKTLLNAELKTLLLS